jgi:hypothetical protein
MMSSGGNDHRFEESRARLAVTLIILAVFIGISIWAMVQDRVQRNPIPLGLCILVMFGFAVALIKRLTGPPRYVVIDSLGIRSDAFPGIGDDFRIKWASVEAVSTSTQNNIPNVVIHTVDQDEIVDALATSMKLLAKSNNVLSGSPFVLCAMNFAVSHEELLNSIQNAWQESQKGQA